MLSQTFVSLFLALSATSSLVLGAPTAKDAVARLRADKRAAPSSTSSSAWTIPTFANSDTDKFVVNTTSLPGVSFDVPQTWAGRFPIKSGSDQELFFWYFPSTASNGSEFLTIWLNGGPGCSSMEGALEENGPIQFKLGDSTFSYNEYAWTNASDILYIEQPVGTGFTVGDVDIKNENDLADEFYGFLGEFFDVFSELTKKKFHIAGESYAGFYIPYIANRILTASDDEKKSLPLDLKGIIINDGVYSSFVVGEEAPTYRFIKANQKVLGFSDDFVAQIKNTSESCGYEKLMDSVTYPANGKLVLPDGDNVSKECDVWDQFVNEAGRVNSCFNVYRITDKCPTPADPIEDYLSKPEVQKALHVADFGNWSECANNNVFANPSNGDPSPYTETLFPSILEQIPVYLWHGLIDSILFSEGDRLTIQNMTWGGQQGFSKEPNTPLTLDGKTYGNYGSERNLTYLEINDAGHMIPQDQPQLALHVFQTLLGQASLEN